MRTPISISLTLAFTLGCGGRGAQQEGGAVPLTLASARPAASSTPTAAALCPADSCRPLRAAVSATRTATCVLRAPGRVTCWGDTTGDGAPKTKHDTPFVVRDLEDAVQLSIGLDTACAVRKSGAVVCWGENRFGQVDPSATGTPRTSPTVVAGLPRAIEVSADANRACAVTEDGDVVCWGAIGGSQTSNGAPTRMREVEGAVHVDAKSGCAVTKRGEVLCAGFKRPLTEHPWARVPGIADAERLMGDGRPCVLRRGGVPVCWNNTREIVPTPPWMNGVVQTTSLDGKGGCVLRSGGALACYASGAEGGGFTEVAEVRDVVSLSGSCALGVSGDLWCWGQRRALPLPRHGVTDRAEPVFVVDIDDAVQIAADDRHTCVARKTGAVACWGRVGRPDRAARERPTAVVGLTDAIRVDTGDCAVRRDGSVACWGRAPSAQRTVDSRESYGGLVIVQGLHDFVQTARSLGACGAQRNGDVTCWSHETSSTGALSPAAVARFPTTHDAIEVAMVAGVVACAVRRSGKVTCHELSMGPEFEIAGLPGAVHLSSGGCAVRGDRTVACFDLPNRHPATPIADLTDALEVDGGPRFGCAVRANGHVACWGENDFGQLGDGTYETRTKPVEVKGIDDAVRVTSGIHHACAVRKTGKVSCWGGNLEGLLGNGERLTESVDAPFRVGLP